MGTYEWTTIIISGIALIVSIVSIIWTGILSTRQNDIYEEQTKIAMGQFEMTIREQLSKTTNRVSDVSREMAFLFSKEDKSEEDKRKLEGLELVFNSAVEANLNVYEEACSKYLDGKIDKERFKKNFFPEIRQLVEKEDLKKEYFDGVTSKYKCILKVYKEWYDLEK